MVRTMDLASTLTLPIKRARVVEKLRRVGKVEAEAKVVSEAEVLHRPARRSQTLFVLSLLKVLAPEVAIVGSHIKEESPAAPAKEQIRKVAIIIQIRTKVPRRILLRVGS